jgi:hypothetical protein
VEVAAIAVGLLSHEITTCCHAADRSVYSVNVLVEWRTIKI